MKFNNYWEQLNWFSSLCFIINSDISEMFVLTQDYLEDYLLKWDTNQYVYYMI